MDRKRNEKRTKVTFAYVTKGSNLVMSLSNQVFFDIMLFYRTLSREWQRSNPILKKLIFSLIRCNLGGDQSYRRTMYTMYITMVTYTFIELYIKIPIRQPKFEFLDIIMDVS